MEKKEISIEKKIQQWKAKYGDVFRVTVGGGLNEETGQIDEKVAYLKKPDRRVLSVATIAGKNDPMKYNEIILNNCWLEGDEEIKTDDAYFLGVSAKLADLVEIKEAELKKL